MSMSVLVAARKKTVRAAVNPLDKSTIVSIFPKNITEIKHTIQPGVFNISAGSYEKPSFLVVTPSSWWKEIDEESPFLEITHSSIQVADSVVKDYCNGILGVNMGSAIPGLFHLPGDFNMLTFKRDPDRIALLEQARTRQIAWYENLLSLANSMWARTNGNPLVISADMRLAATELGKTGLDWMESFNVSNEMIRCVACGAMRNPLYPICGACHTVVDKEKAKSLGIAFTE